MTLTSDKDFSEKVLSAPPEMLSVIDVHAEWCGPCTGLAKRITNLSSDFMDYDVQWCEALAEKCTIFADQAAKSRPLFVLYKEGKEVATMNEANGNKLEELVKAHATAKQSPD
eukprot:CAMPEP_0174715684 /NCGR_PEP_ID=MMETSP1094-20130205/21910_1 /TAXON_ID=156173 /ORGANISM="Chrysochromulina brevifilum, Strain UTEX LB 985" /LENGTH=112 /DNA_ID=CAMNT_0015915297 /DNA_START=123 /DNA_END=461 /DNA_ORIENTATION=-